MVQKNRQNVVHRGLRHGVHGVCRGEGGDRQDQADRPNTQGGGPEG